MSFPAVVLLLALAACGAKPAPATQEATSSTLAIAADEDRSQPAADEGITAIDAAVGDARAMPADSAAPSAYDLVQRAEREKESESRVEAEVPPPVDVARLSSAGDLTSGDESVTSGD